MSGPPRIFTGTSHPALAQDLASALGTQLAPRLLERFPDGELRVQLKEDVRGQDVFLVQPLNPPAGDALLELLLLADAARRSGAQRLTAVIPYFAYARQDRRENPGDPLGASVVATAVGRAVDRAVVVDLHSPSIEGSFGIPVEHLSAQALLAEHVGRGHDPSRTVVVSPDLGGVKRAEKFARVLGLPVAVVHKSRLSGAEVAARAVVGDVKDKDVIVVDDMITTAGTVEAAIEALVEEGCAKGVIVCATHGLFVGPAKERLAPLPISRIVVTDSLPARQDAGLPVEVVRIAPLLAEAIRRMGGPT